MNSTTQETTKAGVRLGVIGFTLIGALRLVDFIFYGYHLVDLASAIGFSLMGYGLYKNGWRSKSGSSTDPSFDRIAHYGMIVGLVLGFGAMVARHWQ